MCMHARFAVHGTVFCLQDQNANVWGPYFILEALELSRMAQWDTSCVLTGTVIYY